ncbi:hypothetical protein BDN67DRAFT_971288 [Paxillus ammoniavirescens]|nr:hypothetical protein BDN67DRAFT_971288 [Paxillus ammoniavirescens]
MSHISALCQWGLGRLAQLNSRLRVMKALHATYKRASLRCFQVPSFNSTGSSKPHKFAMFTKTAIATTINILALVAATVHRARPPVHNRPRSVLQQCRDNPYSLLHHIVGNAGHLPLKCHAPIGLTCTANPVVGVGNGATWKQR